MMIFGGMATMKTIVLLLLLFSCSNLAAQDLSNVLLYEQHFFDSDTCCWRKLANTKEYEKAGNMIVSYLKKNKKRTNSQSLQWHAGQMFAKAQNDKQAIFYFKKTYNFLYRLFGGDEGKAWYFYAKGTVAFIKRDKERLQKMIQKWDKNLPKDRNYDALVQLYENWDKKYLEATE